MNYELKSRLLAHLLAWWRRPSAISRRSTRRLSSLILLVTGSALLLLTLGAYAWMSVEQHRLTADVKMPMSSGFPANGGQTATDHGITMLRIPKIHLDAAVLEGTDRKTLLLAPGHLKKTALPGESGNSVIAGHRDTFFRHVYELNPGDEILVQRGGREYRYVVSSKSVVEPHDTWVAAPTSDARLTLVTCYPIYYIGPAPKRFIVKAVAH